MSPELAHLQLEAGAWAITASTTSQARIFRAFGVSRILIAHQVVDPAAVAWMWEELAADPSTELICLVDSIECVELMERAPRIVEASEELTETI
jgi:D-serine deaminase-like pyridoxal phosphate-dependent protein